MMGRTQVGPSIGKQMERAVAIYPIDIEPAQIVKWLMTEQQATPSLFRIEARRASELRELPAAAKYHLGDEEREDLNEVDTVATLEVSPAHASEGWTLTITVEDEAGPRATGPEGIERQMDLGTFYRQFIRSGRGIATASAEIQGAEAEQHLKNLLNAVLVDRHPPSKTAAHHA
jgi:hypothetical protein